MLIQLKLQETNTAVCVCVCVCVSATNANIQVQVNHVCDFHTDYLHHLISGNSPQPTSQMFESTCLFVFALGNYLIGIHKISIFI